MTNPRAERRNFLHKEIGVCRIKKEDVKPWFTDFTVETSRGDTRTYRVYGSRCNESMRIELFV